MPNRSSSAFAVPLAFALAALLALAPAAVGQAAPGGAPVDLRAIAAALAIAGDQDVLAALPPALRTDLLEAGAGFSPDELEVALAETANASAAGLAAAARVLADAPEQPDAAAWWRIGAAARRFHHWATLPLAKPEGEGRDGQRAAIGAAADRRARAALAALLRDHAESPEADVALLLTGGRLVPAELLLARGARYAAHRDAAVRRVWCEWLLDHGHLDEAVAVAAAAASAAPPRTLGQRELVASAFADVAPRARRHAELRAAATGDSVAAQVAELALLQLGDREAALARSRELVARELQHAAPSTLLGIDAFLGGRRADAERELERALRLPGVGASTVVLQALLRARELEADATTGKPPSGAAAMLAAADAALAADRDPAAPLLRGLRQIGWPSARLGGLVNLTSVQLLVRAVPDSEHVYRMLAAASVVAPDRGSGRRALAAPPPEPLRRSPAVARCRAETAVLLALDLEKAAARLDYVEPFLTDLAALQGDARDAELRRGMLRWAEAAQAAEPAAARAAAAAHFARAARLPFDRGAAAAHTSAWVAAAVRGEPVDPSECVRAIRFLSNDERPLALAVVAATRLLHDRVAAGLEFADEVQPALAGSPLAAIVVDSARAEVLAHRHDHAGAAAAARRALAARAEEPPGLALLDQQLLADRHLHWQLAPTLAGVGFKVALRCETYALPRLPDAARLRELAKSAK